MVYRPTSSFSPRRNPEKPRRVYNGVKMGSSRQELSANWSAERILSVLETLFTEKVCTDGAEYARLGQAREVVFQTGEVIARVQGRAPRSYNVRLGFDAYKPDQWEALTAAAVEQATLAASIVSGEMPVTIDEFLEPLGLELFPSNAAGIPMSCTCEEEKPCKHMWCVVLLMSSSVARDPWELLKVRGLPREELGLRVREYRTSGGGVGGPMPVYVPHLGVGSGGGADGGKGGEVESLESHVHDFWGSGLGLDSVQMPIELPEVSHPLLRRLGPSPFGDAKFPMVGLLATCYDLIAERVILDEEKDLEEELKQEDGSEDSGG